MPPASQIPCNPLQPLKPGFRRSCSAPRVFLKMNFPIRGTHRSIWSLQQKGCTSVALGIALCCNPGDRSSAEDTKLQNFRSERKLGPETHTHGHRSRHQLIPFPSLLYINLYCGAHPPGAAEGCSQPQRLHSCVRLNPGHPSLHLC